MKKLLLLLLLMACGPPQPHWEYKCTKSHTAFVTVYDPAPISAYGGVHVGGGIHLVPRSFCDHTDSTWVIPDTTQ